jgi:hypothetical protein
MVANSQPIKFLEAICEDVHLADRFAVDEYKREAFGDNPIIELLLMREDKVRVELRRENAGHNQPHIHITHTDKIDVSISIETFSVLAGKIDGKTLKHLRKLLLPKRDELLQIWRDLNENDDAISAEKIINSLGLPSS